MKTKAHLTTACLFLWLGIVLLADIPEERKAEILKELEAGHRHDHATSEANPFATWIMNLTQEEREWTIPFARKTRDKINDPSSREPWNGVLAFLGDEDAVLANIAYWRERGSWNGLEVHRAASGLIPVYLEKELFIEETVEHSTGDAPMLMRSFSIAGFILRHIHYNKHYPQDVRDWAGQTERNARERESYTLLRSVVRTWYRANEAYIRAEQYDKVKPGEELPPLQTLKAEGRRIDMNSPKPEGTKGSGAASITNAPKPVESNTPASRPYLWVGACLAFLASTGWLLLKSKKRN